MSYKHSILTDELAAWIFHAAIHESAALIKHNHRERGIDTYLYAFTRIAFDPPFFASTKEIAFYLNVPISRVYGYIEQHLLDTREEHERAKAWKFRTHRKFLSRPLMKPVATISETS